MSRLLGIAAATIICLTGVLADTTDPPAPVPRRGSNSLAASSFEPAATGWPDPWVFTTTPPGAGAVTRDITLTPHGSAAARIDVTTASSEPWHVQLGQSGIALAALRPYEVSFWARASTPRSVDLVLQHATPPYAEVLAQRFTVGTAWREFRAQLTPSTAVPDAILAINLAESSGSVWIDDVKVWSDHDKLGVAAHLMWDGTGDSLADQLAWIEEGGMRWVRFDVGWRFIEPSEGRFSEQELSKLDGIMAALRAKGIRPILVLVESPGWANGDRGPWFPPSDPATYARALGFLAQRYRDEPNMTWEIWNEPNLVEHDANGDGTSPFWMPQADAAGYTALLRASYATVKAADADATVLGGSLAFLAADFLEEMYENGASDSFDGLAIHPYGFTLPPGDVSELGLSGITTRMKALLDAHGDGHRKLWITEVGWHDRAVTGEPDDPTDETRARYLEELAGIVEGWDFVEAVTVFSLSRGQEPASGLVHPDGRPTLSWEAWSRAATAADGP